MTGRVVLITGASSGIGLASALELARAGYTVYGGARRLDPMRPIVEAGGHALALDVTDDASMQAAVDRVIDAEGRIDALVNNAGYGLFGAVEEVPMALARDEIEVNVFGLARMTQLVLPHMRAAGGGRILNMSSIGGTIHAPLGAWYHGSKWMVEGFTSSLRLEVEPFGIWPILIAPGPIDTAFSGQMHDKLMTHSGTGPYGELSERIRDLTDYGQGLIRAARPEAVARVVRRALEDRRPKAVYRVGPLSRSLFVVRRLLPARVFDRMLTMRFK